MVSIQKFINEKGIDWKLVEGVNFLELRTVLDNLMKDRAQRNIGVVRRQAEFISSNFEEKLWEKNVLGEANANQLRDTVLFLIGINFGLRAGDEHYDLRRDTVEKPSQIQFKVDSEGNRCVVYSEDSVTKTHDGGIKDMRKERKIVWVHQSCDKTRCPVQLIEKYISLCPRITPKTKKMNFYLRSLDKPTPSQWYGEQIVGVNTIRKVVGRLLRDAQLNGYFTNHSLRRSGASRLFQSGFDRKLVKEYTGDTSDAVDQYQVTSDEQRKQISRCISGENVKKGNGKLASETEVEVTVSQKNSDQCMSCSCKKGKVNVGQTEDIGKMISDIVSSRKGANTTIKIQIEFGN